MVTWLLMWLNVSIETLNTTLQLLVIYRYINMKLKRYRKYMLHNNNNIQ